ncbi:MAG TPA: cysteine--tRNA ligase [Rhizobiaceae bacterium]|nr:cysteine--tRNA ligase [Rhizobiaceae bacterium]
MSELTIYNTLTRRKERFEPVDKSNVRMYVCGPTVYDFAHIGNARPAIVFDVLFRLLRHIYGPEHVTYVRNITDVDDKINARALRDFPGLPLNEAIATVTQKTEAQYHKDVAALGCLPPTHEPHATAHVPGRVAMIQKLIDKGNAYVATGGEGREVLFDVASMPQYGELSKRRLEEQQAGARIAVEAHKKNPADFVLWKESAASEPGWPAHFHFQGGHFDIHGRPGWHIECSVMSEAHLGPVFDIHGGGLDLIFPHHENEIAQSRCAHGTEVMANYWMHNGFLQVEGKKMSKSEGNFVTIHELLETEKFGGRKWPGEVLRLAMLMTHYREPIDFSVRRLEEAEGIWKRWGRIRLKLSEADWKPVNDALSDQRPAPSIVDALKDDLNTVAAIQALAVLAKEAESGDLNSGSLLLNSIAFLGIETSEAVLEEQVERVELLLAVEERLSLLASKNFAEADRIRDELAAQGIQLMDYKDPDTGERKTRWEVKR